MIDMMTPLFAISCPAVAAALILLSRRHPNIREAWTIAASIAMFLLVLSMAPLIIRGETVRCILFQSMFKGIYIGFKVDAFGEIFAITASSLWVLVSFYSIGYMRTLKEHAQTRYFFAFCFAIMGAVGVALSANLITLFIFFEVITVSTYPLVIHEQSPEALRAGHKYLAYLMPAGTFLLLATMVTYYLAGTTDFTPGGIRALASASPMIIVGLFLAFLLGFMKAAWMPFHSWLPTAMIAPSPVSALLHAVAVVKAGVFGIVRMVGYVFGMDLMQQVGLWLVLACIAGFTMIVGSFFAITQDNLKRRLAYSTISQLSYIILGAALLTRDSIQGAMMHIPFHGYMKITLFLCAGAILVATGKTKVSEMAGIGKSMPVTMLAFSVAAIGMAGIPPVCGFVSKLLLAKGAWAAGSYYGMVFLAVILISSLLDVIYFFPIILTAFFKSPAGTADENGNAGDGGREEIKEAPLLVVAPLAVTALFSLAFFFDQNIFYIYDLARMAISDLFGGG
ncbi:MAG TPA: monovalent cation/H+ antiporter subunit D family protein [Methanothrix sp.]|nr:monovalent cation/H+ antiporter subunit D family protein [Methanothrix sp.]HQI68323.1 monovalent cation/H+ antiporter subunit D family protein [Methanothrix sp.]HRS85398.1 monovalent cation/H+ antiporter subunit D family protein [Methanothrix sp.]HRT17397.1 monovalent cation/H+ antiporter subunit D family protein [Methanothrix sp.]